MIFVLRFSLIHTNPSKEMIIDNINMKFHPYLLIIINTMNMKNQMKRHYGNKRRQ
jgi:hypothetical protein